MIHGIMKLPLVVVIVSLSKAESLGGCPAQFQPHLYYPNLCYHVSDTTRTGWPAAQSACEDLGARLAMPYNRLIHNHIQNILAVNKLYYFGLQTMTGKPTWVDGQLMSLLFDVWLDPSPPIGCAHYAHTTKWIWAIAGCSLELFFVCEYVAPLLEPNIAVVEGVPELQGRVEVYHDFRWGTVASSSPTLSLGRVICQTFGLEFSNYLVDDSIKNGTDLIWLHNVECVHVNTTIEACRNSEEIEWEVGSCTHADDVRLRCQEMMCDVSTFPAVPYAGTSCSGITEINCTVTCVSSYTHTNGEASRFYSCTGANVWTPALPPMQCVAEIASTMTPGDTTTLYTTAASETVQLLMLATTSDTVQMLTTTSETVQMLATALDTAQMLTTTSETVQMLAATSETVQMLATSETVQMLATTSETVHMLGTIPETVQMPMRTEMATVTITTTETLCPSPSLQQTTGHVQSYPIHTRTSTLDDGTVQITPTSVRMSTTTSTSVTSPGPSYSRRTSAMYSTSTRKDDRPSVVAIGSFGVIIFISLIAGAILLDLVTIEKEREVFLGAYETPKDRNKHLNYRQRLSPDGRDSRLTESPTSFYTDDDSLCKTTNAFPSEGERSVPFVDTVSSNVEVYLTPSGNSPSPKVFPSCVNLLKIPSAIPYTCDSDEESISFPDSPFGVHARDIPSRSTYCVPGETVSLNSSSCDLELSSLDGAGEITRAPPSEHELYDLYI